MDLAHYPTFRIAACDLNGIMRGKRVPGSYADKLDDGTVRMPLSALNVDITGADIADSPLVFESGDADGLLLPTGRSPVPLPWLEVEQPLVPMAMHHEDGRPFMGDARNVLAAILERFAKRKLTVIAATELEFTLVDDSGDTLMAPCDPRNGRRLRTPDILSMAQMDAFDAFLSDLYSSAAAMDIPAQTATCECGIGQFEITLHHQHAMQAADNTWLFKTLIKGMARHHGFAATFMAKPFAHDAGNGMHVHFSVLDDAGNNVFDDGGPKGSETMRAAVAGCLAALPGSTLIFAPHANSYTRLLPGAHAPTGAAWAYENRTAALRIPGGAPAARRIEHRVSGGDINPYLMLAAILGAAITGIEDGLEPPPPVTGNAYDQDLPQLAPDWDTAIERFATDPMVARILPRQLIDNLVMTKRQEARVLADLPASQHWKIYVETV